MFQSSIAPKNDRNAQAVTIGASGGVPILDRPEERSQSYFYVNDDWSLVPILDRPEERSQLSEHRSGFQPNCLFQSSIAPKNDRNAAQTAAADLAAEVPILDRPEERSQSAGLRIMFTPVASSNPRSPRRTIAMTGVSRTSIERYVPILDRPEERSQSLPSSRIFKASCSNPRSPRRTIAISRPASTT